MALIRAISLGGVAPAPPEERPASFEVALRETAESGAREFRMQVPDLLDRLAIPTLGLDHAGVHTGAFRSYYRTDLRTPDGATVYVLSPVYAQTSPQTYASTQGPAQTPIMRSHEFTLDVGNQYDLYVPEGLANLGARVDSVFPSGRVSDIVMGYGGPSTLRIGRRDSDPRTMLVRITLFLNGVPQTNIILGGGGGGGGSAIGGSGGSGQSNFTFAIGGHGHGGWSTG